ncbi:MAG: MBL fold metallo-hydrolase [Bifidobacteriaceae bacterium]|jgi:hypothetical protein|nr:MBL fold metallo-hydrolase [Bifidobacteriaceae bacterium]
MVTQINWSRTQWAVGQGFFHSGVVEVGDSNVLYVFDCGSLNPVERRREIDEFRARRAQKIDLLFLSHFDADHVNGVRDLLIDVDVDTVVIPLVPAAERLYSFGKAISQDEDTANDDWYQHLISDPGTVLKELSSNEVIEVHLVEGLPVQNSFEHPSSVRRSEGFSRTAHLNRIEARWALSGGVAGRSRRENVWEWDVMTTAFAKKHQEDFLSKLAEKMNISQIDLDIKISSSSGIEDLLRDKNNWTALVTAYKGTFNDLNYSSLIVYSGPPAEMERQVRTYRARTCLERDELGAWAVRPGWIGTGDQRMGRRCCGEMERRFESRLSHVGTMALPHHGSKCSFHAELLTIFGDNKPVCSASVGTNNKYHHPSDKVIRLCSSNGNHVVVVTENESSRWTESGVSRL